MTEEMARLLGACNLLDKDGGVMLTEGKPPVMPRFWFMGEDFATNTLHYRVTLDNTDKEYEFAFDVNRIDLLVNAELPQKRLVEAAKILMADYRRQNP